METYRSKPTEVEAIQWYGAAATVQALQAHGARIRLRSQFRIDLLAGADGAQGYVTVPLGHWIVRNPGDDSDWWPVDPDYFAAKYEAVTS